MNLPEIGLNSIHQKVIYGQNTQHPAPEDKIRAQRGSPSFNVALEDALEAAARWLWDVPGFSQSSKAMQDGAPQWCLFVGFFTPWILVRDMGMDQYL